MTQLNKLQENGYIALSIEEQVHTDIQRALDAWKEFCLLPKEAKEAYIFSQGVGYESSVPGRIDTKETFQLTYPYGVEKFATAHHFTFAEQNFFDLALYLLTLLEYDVSKIASEMSAPKELQDAILKDKHRWKMRFLHYPSRPYQEGSLIAAPHTDKAGFTIHLIEDMGGLEIFWNDTWNAIGTGHDHIIAYPGMTMQYHTQGTAKGICHQVRMMPEIAHHSRYSVVLFIDFGNIHYDKTTWGNTQKVFPCGENYKMPFEEYKKYFVMK